MHVEISDPHRLLGRDGMVEVEGRKIHDVLRAAGLRAGLFFFWHCVGAAMRVLSEYRDCDVEIMFVVEEMS